LPLVAVAVAEVAQEVKELGLEAVQVEEEVVGLVLVGRLAVQRNPRDHLLLPH
jgi:hypothetical protein